MSSSEQWDLFKDALRRVAEPGVCHEVTDAAGKPNFHYCSLPRWHSGWHLCDFCGSAWFTRGVTVIHDRQESAHST